MPAKERASRPGLGQYQDLIKQKEAEIQNLNEQRFVEMEQGLAAKEEELEILKAKFARLQDDFRYNLQIVEERDGEIQSLEETLAEKDAEAERLKAVGEDNAALREKLEASKKQCEAQRISQDEDAKAHREELESIRADWRRQVADKDHQLEQLRRELATKVEQQVQEHGMQTELLKAQVASLETRLGAAKEEVDSLTGQKSSLAQDLDAANEKWLVAEQKLAQTQLLVDQEKQHASRTTEQAESQIAELTHRVDSLQQDLHDQQRKFHDDLKHTVESITAESSKKEKLISADFQRRLAELVQEHSDQITGYERQLHQVTADCQRRVEEVETGQARAMELAQQEAISLRDELSRCEREFQAERQRSSAAGDADREDLRRKGSEVADLRDRLASAEDRERVLGMELGAVKQQLETARAAVEQRNADLMHLQNQRGVDATRRELTLEAEISKLKTAASNLKSELELHKAQRPARPHSGVLALQDPAFSGDFGPASPLRPPTELMSSDGLMGSVGMRSSGTALRRVQELESENGKLKQVIRDMRMDMEQQAMRGVNESSDLRLQRLLQDKSNALAALEEDKIRLLDQLRDAERRKEELEELLREARAPRTTPEEARLRSQVADLEHENTQSRRKQLDMEDEMRMLRDERSKLYEISNQLRSELNKVTSGTYRPPDQQISERYEAKIAEIEASVTDLLDQNRQLREQLSRYQQQSVWRPEKARAHSAADRYRGRQDVAGSGESLHRARGRGSVEEVSPARPAQEGAGGSESPRGVPRDRIRQAQFEIAGRGMEPTTSRSGTWSDEGRGRASPAAPRRPQHPRPPATTSRDDGQSRQSNNLQLIQQRRQELLEKRKKILQVLPS